MESCFAKENSTDLFEIKSRNYTGKAFRSESIYSFLDRSSHPETMRLRRMLQRWVDRLPVEDRLEFVSRMRHKGPGSKRNDSEFNATFFELFLHEFLIGTQGSVEVQPRMGKGKLDFRVCEEGPYGARITYAIEATDINLESGTGLERDQNDLAAIDTLNEIDSPWFRLIARTNGKLKQLPSKKKLKAPFEKLIKERDYWNELEFGKLCNYDSQFLPTAVVQHQGWTLRGLLVPVAPEFAPSSGPFVLLWPVGSSQIDDIGKTKSRLEEKAAQHKGVDNLIIALCCSPSNDRIDEALFGRKGVSLRDRVGATVPNSFVNLLCDRRRDGFWANNSGPIHQSVIGVAIFQDLNPWSLDSAKAFFYSNPYINRHFPEWTKEVSHADYSNGDVRHVEGVPPKNFLANYECVGDLFC